MTPAELQEIRERDGSGPYPNEANAHHDRRALLAYVDELEETIVGGARSLMAAHKSQASAEHSAHKWKARAEAAEARVRELSEALQRIECNSSVDYDEATGMEIMCDCCTAADERARAVLAKGDG